MTNIVPGATVGDAYTGTVTMWGGQAPYAWSAVSGLPPGLTETANGNTILVSGTPTTAGTYPVEVKVRDGSTPQRVATESLTLSVTVYQPPTALTFVLPLTSGICTVGSECQLGMLVEGGKAPYSWTATGLPPGVAAVPQQSGRSLTFVGTPTKAGTFSGSAVVTDSENPPHRLTQNFTITINPKPWTAWGDMAPNATVGTPYTAIFLSTQGVTLTWTASGLPPGLSVNPATGTISGTPATAGNYFIIVSATNTATGVTKGAGDYGVLVKP